MAHGYLPSAAGQLCADASNDYQAVNAWLSLHESAATQRAYRKEAERLILWAIVERGRALSSLTTEDAIAYRAFLRHPSPRARWVGAPQPRSSPAWRPSRATSRRARQPTRCRYSTPLYRWLIEQRYVLANPFAGVKVRGGRPAQLDTSHAFTEHEWKLVRVVADGLEWSYGWSEPAAAAALHAGLRLRHGPSNQRTRGRATGRDRLGRARRHVDPGRRQGPQGRQGRAAAAGPPPSIATLFNGAARDALEVASIDHAGWQPWRGWKTGFPRGGCGE